MKRYLIVVPYAAAVLSAWVVSRQLGPLPSGLELNRLAWRHTFEERGLPVPADGPRDGYWGSGKPHAVQDTALGWREAESRVVARFDTNALGFQSAGQSGAPRHIMILGGSVAWGAYASSPAKAYFSLIAEREALALRPVRISVLAAGAWDSENELDALRDRAFLGEPDLVVLIDGLNDLTDSGRRRRDGQRVPMDARVGRYLGNMERAKQLTAEHHVPIVFCLQPFLLPKRSRTRIENRILSLSFSIEYPEEFVRRAYPLVRQGLRQIAGSGDASFVDCSGVFDRETATTFADLWHFTDPGQELLPSASTAVSVRYWPARSSPAARTAFTSTAQRREPADAEAGAVGPYDPNR